MGNVVTLLIPAMLIPSFLNIKTQDFLRLSVLMRDGEVTRELMVLVLAGADIVVLR